MFVSLKTKYENTISLSSIIPEMSLYIGFMLPKKNLKNVIFMKSQDFHKKSEPYTIVHTILFVYKSYIF